ncbi:hypothetical protein [Pseudomonas gingeri]|uniref:Uncharacterized protein n=1 Tax=Pseudomonas gingeri TaxID=117681 RepID=A0A7Y7WM26_9PSED|nr:hypothetical protein [Pseudomonas gingeri]NWB83966.1 hypothetical protein [Pseudomonas gingeri]
MPLLIVQGLVTRDPERDFHVVDVDLPGNQRKHCLYRSQSQTTPNDPNRDFVGQAAFRSLSGHPWFVIITFSAHFLSLAFLRAAADRTAIAEMLERF